MPTARRSRPREGFTLIELLVVIAIIVLLISILLPVVGTVRVKAQVTQTQAEMDKLRAAIMNYYHDWNTYPGPLANDQLAGNVRAGQTGIPGLNNVTSSENLALGLLGYLDAHYNPPGPPTLSLSPANSVSPPPNTFPPRPPNHDVLNLNPVQPKTYHYIDFVPSELSQYGHWPDPTVYVGVSPPTDSTGQNNPITDTTVPEFLDTINSGIGPMPILYVRANAGTPGIWYTAPATPVQQYDISQFKLYGFTTPDPNDFPGTGLTPASPWTQYLMNANLAGTPKGKDGFILISAGADRKYGTVDDIIVTP